MDIGLAGQIIAVIGILTTIGAIIHKMPSLMCLGIGLAIIGTTMIDFNETLEQKQVQELVVKDLKELRRAMQECLDQHRNFIVGEGTDDGFETRCVSFE